mgnify:CR=1 FL=1
MTIEAINPKIFLSTLNQSENAGKRVMIINSKELWVLICHTQIPNLPIHTLHTGVNYECNKNNIV